MLRLVVGSRLSRIVSKASKGLISWEGKKYGVTGTVGFLKLKGKYNSSVFKCTRRLRGKVIVQLQLKISHM